MASRREVTVLSGSDLREVLTLGDVVQVVESAYLAVAAQEAMIYPVIREPLPTWGGVFGIKSGYWPERKSLGLKVAGYWPRNRERGLENHQATVVLVDPSTGVPRVIIDGNFITSIRTSAAGVVGLKHLARHDARNALIIGAGVQAEAQARAVTWWLPTVKLAIFEPLDSGDQSIARAFCDHLSSNGIAATPSGPLEAAARRADIIITTTPATRPVLRSDWLTPGVHINAMGADTAGKGEHEIATLRRSLVVVDDWRQASRLGECQHAVRAGLFKDEDHPPPIGAVIAGQVPGRTDDRQLTLFDATGLALQDLATAELAAHLASERGHGQIVQLD